MDSVSYVVLLNFPPVPRIYRVNGAVSGLYLFRFRVQLFPRCLKMGQSGHSLINQIGYFDTDVILIKELTKWSIMCTETAFSCYLKKSTPFWFSVRGDSILGYGLTLQC
jgi:hypothetical protein